MTKINWIRPGMKREEVKCEYCGADVSTPYKGVHWETELVNGIPIQCRNNGRLNCDIAYPALLKIRTPQPNGNKWFVEHPETRLWWSGYKWTNDPHEAFACDCEMAADRFAKLQGIQNYIVTEHIFVNQQQ